MKRRPISVLCKLCRRKCYFVSIHCRERIAIRCEQCLGVFCRSCARKHFTAEEKLVVREIARSLSPKERQALDLVAKQVKRIERQWRNGLVVPKSGRA